MSHTIINLGRDFSPYPFGRYRTDGRYSAERFRTEYLVPALKKDTVTVVLDDVPSEIGSSFLEEAFGGLVRTERWNLQQLMNRLVIESRRQDYTIEIMNYIHQAAVSGED